MSYIQLNQVKKSFKNQLLFENVSFSIEKGTITGFSGDNGCGKSVLFKLICGIYKPDVGEVIINNNSISQSHEFPDSIGVLIDEPGFVDIYSGFKNLRFLADIKHKISNQQIVDTMRAVGLSPENKEKVKHYSLGMKKKLGIAQAIMENQEIVILDEPFNALDVASKEKIKDIIVQLIKANKAVLITNHNQMELNELCDTIYEIKEQQLCLVKS